MKSSELVPGLKLHRMWSYITSLHFLSTNIFTLSETALNRIVINICCKELEDGLVGGLHRWNRHIQPKQVPGKRWKYLPRLGLQLIGFEQDVVCECMSNTKEKITNIWGCPVCLWHPHWMEIRNWKFLFNTIDDWFLCGRSIGFSITPALGWSNVKHRAALGCLSKLFVAWHSHWPSLGSLWAAMGGPRWPQYIFPIYSRNSVVENTLPFFDAVRMLNDLSFLLSRPSILLS